MILTLAGKQILQNISEMLAERLYSLLSKLCCQYDKTYSQILGFRLNLKGETFVSKWTKYSASSAALCSEGESHVEKEKSAW